jgi:hypothetical protein
MVDAVRTMLGEKHLTFFVLPHDQLAAAEFHFSEALSIADNELFRGLFGPSENL